MVAFLWNRGLCYPVVAALLVILATMNVQADWLVRGDANFNGNYIALTPAAGDSAGASWMDQQIDLSADFDITLLVNLGTRDSDGADGLSIVFQNDPAGTGTVGDTSDGGKWIGMYGIYPALCIEIDTWQNSDFNDPSEDHIGIHELRNGGDDLDHGSDPVSVLGNIEDGNNHVLRMVWNSATNTLRVYFDGTQHLTYTNDIVADIFGGDATAWFGLVASTGGAFNLQQFRALAGSAELGVTKTVWPASVDPGDAVSYTVTIQNNSPITAFVTRIEDQLPAGFSYLGPSSGLTSTPPTISGQTLTWNGNWSLAPGQTETLTFVAQSTSTPGTYANIVTVGGNNFSDVSSGATASVIVGSDLSTSTKGVVDVNGGDAEPGDILRYTLTLVETAGHDAASVSVSDEIPADVTDFTVISVPPGATETSTGTGSGANGTGRLQVADISVAAGGSVAIVFEVTIAAGTPDGTSIDNTAVITNPNGVGASPSAVGVIVSQSSNPASGNKPLYFYSADRSLNRTPPPTNESRVRINGGNSDSWVLTPALASSLIVSGDAGEIPVQLWLRSTSSSDVTVSLSLSPVSDILTIGSSWALYTFRIPVSGDSTLSVGDSITLTIQNNSSNRIRFDPYNFGEYSKVDLEAKTVINVDNVTFYDAAYPMGNLITSVVPGQNIYIRSLVSDPFGSYDISSASLFLTTPTGVVMVNNAAMTEVAADANGPFKTFEYLYPDPPDTWPAGFVDGIWTARVTAEEGTEGLVRDTGVGTFRVASPPDIVMLKSVSTESDPVNSGINPMAIPGALMLYTVTVTNTGGSGADSDSIEVTDAIPGDVKLYVGNPILPGGPVIFNDGMPSSGLSYDFSSDIAFYTNSDCTGVRNLWPDADGCDDAVRCMRVNPKGIFNGNGGTFTLQFRVRVH